MTEIWDRYYSITIDGLMITIDDLDVEFSVEGSNEPNANKAEISIYNLADATKEKIKKGAEVEIDAGYRDDHGVIFVGTVDRRGDLWEGGDVRTRIICSDAMKALYQADKITKTYEKGAPITTAVRDMFTAAGLAVGQIDDPGITFPEKHTVEDTPYQNLLRILETTNGALVKAGTITEADIGTSGWTFHAANNLGWFVQRTYSGADTMVLASDTGLMEATPEEESDSGKLTLSCQTLLSWRVTADTQITLESLQASGLFKVLEYSHSCKGDEFYTGMTVEAAE